VELLNILGIPNLGHVQASYQLKGADLHIYDGAPPFVEKLAATEGSAVAHSALGMQPQTSTDLYGFDRLRNDLGITTVVAAAPK
jgi:hypothetical protein